jgi:hypothetical protein
MTTLHGKLTAQAKKDAALLQEPPAKMTYAC